MSANKKIYLGPHWFFDPKTVDPGDLREAIAEYRTALQANPELSDLHRQLGNVLVLSNEIEKALVEYHEAARLRPNESNIHREAAYRLYLRDQLDLTIAELKESIRLEPTNSMDHTLLGMVYHQQGKPGLAFASYRDAALTGGISSKVAGTFQVPSGQCADMRQSDGIWKVPATFNRSTPRDGIRWCARLARGPRQAIAPVSCGHHHRGLPREHRLAINPRTFQFQWPRYEWCYRAR